MAYTPLSMQSSVPRSVGITWSPTEKTPKSTNIDRNRGTYMAGQRFDTGRVEAPIHPYNCTID